MGESKTFAALNLDIIQQQSFVRFFNGLPEKAPSTVRLFNRTDYYTLHGDDANLAADFASKVINYMGETPKLSYVCINKHQMEMLLRELLLVRQYRVEVYCKTPGKNNDWQLEFKGSPGNISQFEQILFDNVNIDSSNCVIGIKLYNKNSIAIGSINSTDLKFEVGEFLDNDCFTQLESLLAQIAPKECIIPSGDSPELKTLKSILERNGILVAPVKRSEFNSDDIMQDLNKLLYFNKNQEKKAEIFPETNLKDAMGCLQAVIRFLNLTGSEENYQQYKIGNLDTQQYVRLDNSVLYALNILPKPSLNNEGTTFSNNTSKSFSLLGILNNCVTPQGRRLLEQWIREPLKDQNLINERLDIVECFVKNSEVRTLVSKDALSKMPDFMLLSKKLLSKKAKLQDCYRLYQAINFLPSLINILQNPDNKCVKEVLIDPLKELTSDMDKYQTMIETVLDLDLVDRCEFLIKSNVHPEIKEVYELKQEIEEKMQKLLKKAANDLNLEEGKSIKLECNPQHGHFFRITKKEEQVLRHCKSYKIIDAIAGGIRFNNEKLEMLNTKYADINSKYEELQKEMVDEIIRVAASYADTVRNINMVLAILDVLVSFANTAVSANVPYVRPVLKPAEDRVLKLKKVRHPCLEQQDHFDFIPNDVNFNEKDKLFYVITGPNMCGKSTYIGSIGICVLMAHIGSWVPCDYAEISLVDAILARVGADDCQLKGLSTFMLEMLETSTIVKTATQHSLVIIDELGRGTSTYDGCGIAWAIAEHLATEIKCFSLFATHFHKITKLGDMYPMVGNLHVSAVTSNNEITPLYQVKDGECDKSYGIHCAKIVDFPTSVLNQASKNLSELEHHEGLKYINDEEISVKKRVVEEGDQNIKDCLNKVKLAINSISDEDLKGTITAIKQEVMDTKNLFVKGLIN